MVKILAVAVAGALACASALPVTIRLKESKGRFGRMNVARFVKKNLDGVKPYATFQNVFQGFSADLPVAQIQALNADQRVREIYFDAPSFALETTELYGLDRIDQDGQSPVGARKYYEPTHTGAGVDVWVLDTGIAEHVDFEDRVKETISFIPGQSVDDTVSGHGTHCAGTIAGKKYGVAKQANIHVAKVLSNEGSSAGGSVVSGIDHVVMRHLQKVRAGDRTPTVMSMSLGGPGVPDSVTNILPFIRIASTSAAVDAAWQKGVVGIVAAGNDSRDARVASPANSERGFTVGASDANDEIAYFSNWGPRVDIFAPGVGIESASHTSTTGSRSLSGTSMACPHVAGAAALWIQAHPDAFSSDAVKEGMLNDATKNAIGGAPRPMTTSTLLRVQSTGKHAHEYSAPTLVSPDKLFSIEEGNGSFGFGGYANGCTSIYIPQLKLNVCPGL